MHDQTDPAIWFDSWSNDLRDNDVDGQFDHEDLKERRLAGADGGHYGTRERHAVWNARVFRGGGAFSTRNAPGFLTRNVRVEYKVCVDVPIESYLAANVPVPPTPKRQVGELFDGLRRTRGWRVWDRTKGDGLPDVIDGDIVAANSKEHQHAGIIEVSWGTWVINLPGPTTMRELALFSPSGLNDMVTVSYALFEYFRPVDLVARWIGS